MGSATRPAPLGRLIVDYRAANDAYYPAFDSGAQAVTIREDLVPTLLELARGYEQQPVLVASAFTPQYHRLQGRTPVWRSRRLSRRESAPGTLESLKVE